MGLADAGLSAAKLLGWPRSSAADVAPIHRILLLRLERVGDLVMVLEAIAMVRAMAPDAAIDLVVGSWNRSLADLITAVQIETLDVPWMARERAGLSWTQLMHGRARAWRRKATISPLTSSPTSAAICCSRCLAHHAAWDFCQEAEALP